MTSEKLSALLSLIAATVVVAASYFQWWHLTYRGKLIAKPWVKVMLAGVIALLVAAAILLFV